MGESKVCPLCSEIIEEPPFPDTFNDEDFSLLVRECQSRKKSSQDEDTGPLDDEGIITWLLQNASTVTHYFWDIAHMVSECGKGDTKHMLAALEEYGVYIKYKDRFDQNYHNNAIFVAAKFGTPDIITWVAVHGSSVDNEYFCLRTCLTFAAEHGKLENIKQFLKIDTKINYKFFLLQNFCKMLLLLAAIQKGHMHIVKWVVEQKKCSQTYILAILSQAIESKQYDIVEWLVSNKVSIIGCINYRTPVHFAAKVGNTVVMKFLVQKGAELFSKTERGETVVHMAAKHGHLELLKWLHSQGGNIQEQNKFGLTPLHIASLHGQLECAKYLVHNKCDVNATSKYRMSVVQYAVKSKNFSLVMFLKQHKANMHHLDFLKMFLCIYTYPKLSSAENEAKAEPHTLINNIKWLLQSGLQVTDIIAEPEFWLCSSKNNNWDLLCLCMNYLADVNIWIKGKTILHYAATHVEALKIIMQHNAYVNVFDAMHRTPLFIALSELAYDSIHYLLDHGAIVNVADMKGNTLLHLAVSLPHLTLDIVAKLISLGANVNANNNQNETPLRSAIFDYANLDTVHMLINAGADVNSLDRNNSSILTKAVDVGTWNIVKMLIENGADLTLGVGSNLINKAVFTSDVELVSWLFDHGATIEDDHTIFTTLLLKGETKINMIRLLLQNGADVNERSAYHDFNTILHESIEDVSVIDFLLRNGANVNIQDYMGFSVLHTLIMMCNKIRSCYIKETLRDKYRIVQKLLHAGANVNLRDDKGNTALHFAVTNESFVDIVKLLVLSHGADINARNEKGDSVLHLTTSGEIGLFLCEQGSHINCKNLSGVSVLQSAIKHSAGINVTHLNIVNLLQTRNINTKKTASSVVIINSLAACRYFKYIDFLVKNVKDINEVDNNGLAAVHYAAEFGKLSVLQDLVSMGANMTCVTNNGNSILHLAILRNEVEKVKYILDNFKCESYFVANKENETPLHLAAISNNAEIAELVVQHVDVNCKVTYNDRTALHMACTNDNVLFVKILVANGADIHMKDYLNFTPVQLAIKHCSLEILKYFATEIDKSILNLKSDTQETLLHLAVKFGHEHNVPNKIVEFLLSQNEYPIDTLDCKGNSALHYACLTFMVDIVTMLVEHGANINLRNKKSDTPFHFAARTGSIDIIKYLLENSGDPNIKNNRGNTPNHISVAHGRINPSQYLLQRGADIFMQNKKGNCIIQLAAVSGGRKMLSHVLLNFASVDVNITNKMNQTALSLAIKIKCNISNIETLIDKQKDINHQDKLGNTVLHNACRYNSTSYVEKLIDTGANVNLKNNDGDTPLHIACKYVKDASVITLLMDHFDNFACVNNSGWNLLHCAVSANSLMNIQMLLSLNLYDTYAKTNDGSTILHIASKNANQDIFIWLVEHFSLMINERNNYDDTVLFTCLKTTYMSFLDSITDALIYYGADPHITCGGYTALHRATILGNPFLTTYLITRGLDMNARTHLNDTSLHLAARSGCLYMVENLVEAGCDVNALNGDNLTAMDIAIKHGYNDVMDFLMQHVNLNNEEA